MNLLEGNLRFRAKQFELQIAFVKEGVVVREVGGVGRVLVGPVWLIVGEDDTVAEGSIANFGFEVNHLVLFVASVLPEYFEDHDAEFGAKVLRRLNGVKALCRSVGGMLRGVAEDIVVSLLGVCLKWEECCMLNVSRLRCG